MWVSRWEEGEEQEREIKKKKIPISCNNSKDHHHREILTFTFKVFFCCMCVVCFSYSTASKVNKRMKNER